MLDVWKKINSGSFIFLKFLGPSSFISEVGLVAASFFHTPWVLEEQLRGFLSGSVDSEFLLKEVCKFSGLVTSKIYIRMFSS